MATAPTPGTALSTWLPNLTDPGAFSGATAISITDGLSTTNWVEVIGSGDSETTPNLVRLGPTDISYTEYVGARFHKDPISVHLPDNRVYMRYQPSSPVSTAGRKYLTFDIAWYTSTPLAPYLEARASDSAEHFADDTGTAVTTPIPFAEVNFVVDSGTPKVYDDRIWTTVVLDVSGLTEVASVGVTVIDTVHGDGGTPISESPWWVEDDGSAGTGSNGYFEFAIKDIKLANLDAAVDALDSGPPVVEDALTYEDHVWPTGKSRIDLRPGREVITGVTGTRNIREWGIPNDGSVDVTDRINTAISDLNDGETLEFNPGESYLCHYDLKLYNKSWVTLDFRGAYIFDDQFRNWPATSYQSDHLHIENTDHCTVRNLNLFGGRGYLGRNIADSEYTILNDTSLTVDNTDTSNISIDFGEALDSIQLDPFTSTAWDWSCRHYEPGYGVVNRFDVHLTATSEVTEDCVVTVRDELGDFIHREVLNTTTGSVVHPIRFNQPRLDRKFHIVISKRTTTGTMTVEQIDMWDDCENGDPYSNGIHGPIRNKNLTIENCWIENVVGEGIAISLFGDPDTSTTMPDNCVIRDCTVRGPGYMGITTSGTRNLLVERCDVWQAGLSSYDLEPGTTSYRMRDCTIRNCTSHFPNNHGFVAENWARNEDMTVDGFHSVEARLGAWFGGANGAVIRNLSVVQDDTYSVSPTNRETADYEFVGRNMDISDVQADYAIGFTGKVSDVDYGGGDVTLICEGNSITDWRITGKHNAAYIKALDGTIIGHGSYSVDPDSSPQGVTTAFMPQGSVDSGNYSTLEASDHEVAGLRTPIHSLFPNTYRGPVYNNLWHPWGIQAGDMGVIETTGISGTSEPARNLRGIDITATTGTQTVTFPSRITSDNLHANQSWVNIGSPFADNVANGSLSDGTYYYRAILRPHWALGPTGEVSHEWSQVVNGGGSSQSVEFETRLRDFTGEWLHGGITIYRSSVDGVDDWEVRYDIAAIWPFFSTLNGDSQLRDTGTELQWRGSHSRSHFGWHGTGVRNGDDGGGHADDGTLCSTALGNRWDGSTAHPYHGTSPWTDVETETDESGWEPDADYGIWISPSWNTNWYITNKTMAGFDVTWENAPSSDTFDWFLVR